MWEERIDISTPFMSLFIDAMLIEFFSNMYRLDRGGNR